MAYTFKHGDRPLEGMTVQRAVGRGGFGEVYYALTDSGKQVALKYLREHPEIELRGISHVMNLKSPHLITIYDVRTSTEGEPFVVMEYVGGPSLRELLLAEPGGLGVQKAAFFVDGIAKGLAYLHDRGIVHRDLKPANIFYDDGYVKIGDYGLSKHISISQHSGQTVSVGTVHYMAPEIGSGAYTKAIDIYALGVILFEMLTGRLPFTGASMGEILMRHLSDRPDLAGIPEPFMGVIAKALAKDPNDRYQDASAMADVLRQHVEVSASISSFDPATLTHRPRAPEAVDPEATLTTPHRGPAGYPPVIPPPPPMDVRQAALQQGLPDSLAERLQKKADRIARKLETGAQRLRRRAGGWAGGHMAAATGKSGADEPLRQTHRRGQIFVLLAVAAAVGIGLSLMQPGGDAEDRAVALVFCILAGTFGPLLSYFKFLLRSPARSPLWDKLTYGGVTAMFMIPALGIASDVGQPALMRMMVAPLAALVLCDWTRRIEAGRCGEVSGGQAFWPATVGFIAASISHAEGYQFTAACVCATMSLLGQAGAALWPLGRSSATPLPRTGGRSAGPAQAAVRPGPGDVGVAPAPWASATAVEAPRAGGRRGVELTRVRVPRSGALRVVYAVLAVLVASAAPGLFFALVVGQPEDPGECSGLLFGTLAFVAWLPFLIIKARQGYKMPWWPGTLRPLLVSAALTLTAGMISIISFDRTLQPDELGAAIFGLVASSICALLLLVTAVWPHQRRAGSPYDLSQPADELARPVPAPAIQQAQGSRSASAGRSEPATATEQTPAVAPPPLVIDAAAPSFAGRAASAGISFLGKLLLLAAIVLAVGGPAWRNQAEKALGESGILQPGELNAWRGVIDDVLGAPILLLIAVGGSALLLLARRGGGGSHALRGCVGCLLGLWAMVMALGPAASAWKKLWESRDWSVLDWGAIAGPLAVTALPLAIAFVLLTWPGRRDNTVFV